MSTKCTLSYDDDFHLYEECFDTSNVYIRLDGSGWKTQLDVDREGPTSITLQIDVKLWRKIVEGWNGSHWGKNPQQDYEKIEIDLGFIDRIFKKSKGTEDGETEDPTVDKAAQGKGAVGVPEL